MKGSGAFERVESIVARFEEAQQQGESPEIEQFLPADPAERRAVLIELVHADLEFRIKAQEAARVETYLARFPELADDSKAVRGLIEAEFEFRRRREPNLLLAEYLERFPQYRGELQRVLMSTDTGRLASSADDRATIRALPGDSISGTHPWMFQPQLMGYELVNELGRGGMGVVYRARDKRGHLVALKTLQWVDAAALYRFKQEFRALADVNHPNLVTLHELVSDGQRWFFTMELVDGVDFFSYIRPYSPAIDYPGDQPTIDSQKWSPNSLSPEQISKLRSAMVLLTEGLLALHDAGKLHRDVKPRNVLVTPQGRVVLLDFGLAANLDHAGRHVSTDRHVIGTLSYMSPEQAQALELTEATDWFSVGVMLYEVLTGELPILDRSALPPFRSLSATPTELIPPIVRVHDTPRDLNDMCLALLENDPQTRLSGRELLQRLLAGMPQAQASLSTAVEPRMTSPFIGRESQLEALSYAFSSVRGGKTEVVLVHGRSGTGKSALIQRFLDTAQGETPTVILAGRCYERESVPYKALDSAVDALSRFLKHLPLHEAQALLPRNMLSLARVFPVLRRVEAVGKVSERAVETPDPQELRRRAFSALRELLARMGDRKPLIFYIDDLQWGDIDSAELLTELLRPPDPPVMLLLGCYRTDDAPASPLLKKLLAVPENIPALANRRELAIDTLSQRESQELAHLLLGGQGPLADEQAAAVARESRGNPFFVQELVQYLKAGSGLGERPGSTGEILLDNVLWERVQRLPEGPRGLLEVLAVAGQPLHPAQASLAVHSPEELRTAIALLRAGHLIRGAADDSLIEPYHDRIRETIVSHLPSQRLREHHLRLAHTLEGAGEADPEMLAIHFQGAGELERAGACFAEAAASAAEALAFEHASRLYRLSLKLRPVLGSQQRELLVRLGDALASAGRGAEAAQELLKAAAAAEKRESLILSRRAAEQYMVSGHIDEGLAVLSKVLAAVGLKLPATPRGALLSLLVNRARFWLRGRRFRERDASQIPPEDLMRIDACWSVTAGLSMVDTIRGADFQTRHLLYALRAGEPARITRALAFEAGHVASEGGRRAKQADDLLRAADELAQRVGTPQAIATAMAARGIVAALMGRWPEARDFSDRAEAMFRERCTGVAWELGTVHRFAYWARVYMGEVKDVSLRLPTLLKDARERNDLYAVTSLNNAVLPMIYLANDEPDRIEAEVYAGEPPPRKEFHVQHYVRLFDLSQTDMYCGRGRAAWERVSTQWPLLAGSFLLRVQQVRIFALYLRGRCALMAGLETPGQCDELWRAAEADAVRLASERMPWSDGLAALLQASICAARGDLESATGGFGRAAAQLDKVAMGMHAAAARRRQGALLGGEAGQRLISQADAWMTEQTIKCAERITNMLAPG